MKFPKKKSMTIPTERSARRRFLAGAATAAAIPLFSTAPLSGMIPQDGDTGENSNRARSWFRATVDLFLHSNDAPPLRALSAALVTPSWIATAHFGKTDPENDSGPPDDRTAYEIASLSKTFTGILLAEAIRRNELQPDATLGELFPLPTVESASSDESVPPDGPGTFPAAGVTLRQLATHTSGLSRLPGNFIPLMNRTPSDPYSEYDRTLLYKAIHTEVPRVLDENASPEYVYSNFGYAILTEVVTRAAAGTSGTPAIPPGDPDDYARLLHERLTGPLGMDGTWVQDERTPTTPDGVVKQTPEDANISGYATPHNTLGQRSQNWRFRCFQGGGGIVSTLADMTRYLRAMLHPEETPLQESITAAQKINTQVNENLSLALGWHIAKDGTFFHDGETGGYHSYLAFHPQLQSGVVLLASCADGRVNRLGSLLMRAVTDFS